MSENIKEFLEAIKKSRLWVVVLVFVIIYGILLGRMFHLQIVNGEEYQDNYTYSIVKERTLNSSRGNIYDRNGRLLAYNELSYTITIEDNGSYDSTKDKNKLLNAQIAEIITEIEKNGDSITNNFKISYNEDGTYSYNVTGTSLKRFLADVYGHLSASTLGYDKDLGYDLANATPDQVMEYLMTNSKFGVSKEYDKELAYKIVVIRYAMSEKAYQKYISTTIATQISDESVAYISENAYRFQGVEIVEDTIRKYADSKYFAAIIGYTGRISLEEYETLSAENDGYTLNDVIGKAGVEQVMDTVLQGSKGYEKLYVDYLGKTIEIIEREEPVAGNDVYLSIDADLTIAAYDLLEQEIAGIVYSNIENYYSDIPIPITEVYFALINNNVIDMTEFDDEDAQPYEKQVYEAFVKRQEVVLASLENEFLGLNTTPFGRMNEENQDYITYIINYLKTEKILNTSLIDKTDSVYKEWQAGNIGVQDYLKHAIVKGWIDITRFSIDTKYSDSMEVYEALYENIQEECRESKAFSKIIYQYMLELGLINGKQLCLILYEQNVLPYDDEEIAQLENNTVSTLTFMKEKIKNLSITPAQLGLDPCTGSCVLTDVNTGELLAVVSYPGYDNNRLANTIDAAYYASMQEDLTKPFYNKATQERTAPGSTFKMITSTAGLVEGVITTTSEIYDKGAYEHVSNHPKCWKYPSSHGSINVSEAIRDSCNYFYYEVGYRLSTNGYLTKYNEDTGIEKLTKYASMFGLDETTGVEIIENSPQIANEYPVMAAIGQSNHNFTTVQLARYATALANSGTVYEYTILKKVCDTQGNVMQTFEPSVRNTVDVLSDAQWNAIHTGMRMMVESSSDFRGFPIAVAGKTGTAQQDLRRANHALFIGYAPYENPQISIATRIAFGYTSHNASHYAKNVLSYYFEVEDKNSLLDGQAVSIDSSSNAVND